jgi:hypothetical protein
LAVVGDILREGEAVGRKRAEGRVGGVEKGEKGWAFM